MFPVNVIAPINCSLKSCISEPERNRGARRVVAKKVTYAAGNRRFSPSKVEGVNRNLFATMPLLISLVIR